MPIKVQNDLPARQVVIDENIFVMDENRAMSQDIRPLKIAILNLMPLKEDTEVHLLRSLSNTPLQLDITFLTTATYVGSNTAKSHLDQFYLTFDDVKDQKFDGLIITGAPVEQMEFEEVLYWDELKKIMDWSLTNVTSTIHICWGAQAALYYHYGIPKIPLPEKMFGLFRHRVMNRREPLVRGFDDEFYMPHSRHTTVSRDVIAAHPFSVVDAPLIAFQLFNKMIDKNPNVSVRKCRRLTITRDQEGPAHYDGEPVTMGKEIHIELVQGGLKALIPDKRRTI